MIKKLFQNQKWKKKSSFIVISIFVTIIFNFTGCSQKSDWVKSKKKQNLTTFTFYSKDNTNNDIFNDEIAHEIEKRTGVTLKIINTPVDSDEAISLMIANADYPDLIYAKDDLNKLIEACAIVPLDHYIREKGENLKKLYGKQLTKLRNSKYDQKIYTVGTFDVNENKSDIYGNVQIQNAVLKELGYPSIRTLEEYENAMLAYKNKYPEIAGHKTIGLSLIIDPANWVYTLSNPANYVLGYQDNGFWIVDEDNAKVTYKFLYPGMETYFKWLNRLYNEDLLDPETFTQSYDVWHAKMSSGYVLGTIYPYWNSYTIRTNLIQNKLQTRTYAYLPVTADKAFLDPALKDYGYSGGWGIAISVSCKNPERAFDFLDWYCTDEAQILVNWGIEGKHYYLNEEGKRVSVGNLNEQEIGIGKWVYPFPQAGSGYVDSTGNILGKTTREQLISGYTIFEKQTLSAYGVELWSDLFPTPEELGVSKYGQIWQYVIDSRYTDRLTKINEYVRTELIKMIMGEEKDFDSSWKTMQNQILNMNVTEISDELHRMILSKMDLWNMY